MQDLFIFEQRGKHQIRKEMNLDVHPMSSIDKHGKRQFQLESNLDTPFMALMIKSDFDSDDKKARPLAVLK